MSHAPSHRKKFNRHENTVHRRWQPGGRVRRRPPRRGRAERGPRDPAGRRRAADGGRGVRRASRRLHHPRAHAVRPGVHDGDRPARRPAGADAGVDPRPGRRRSVPRPEAARGPPQGSLRPPHLAHRPDGAPRPQGGPGAAAGAGAPGAGRTAGARPLHRPLPAAHPPAGRPGRAVDALGPPGQPEPARALDVHPPRGAPPGADHRGNPQPHARHARQLAAQAGGRADRGGSRGADRGAARGRRAVRRGTGRRPHRLASARRGRPHL